MSLRAVIFGASGMIGQALLLECLDDKRVTQILLVNRTAGWPDHPKVKEVIHNNFNDFSSLAPLFSEYNTCFFCLGISAVGMSEPEYNAITFTITVKAAEALLDTGKPYTFCYISGAGTDSSEKGRTMWARVKGKTENKLLSMPFEKAYMFRPGYIQPMRGVKSKTKSYNTFYFFLKPVYFLLKPWKSFVTDSRTLGKAMINTVAKGYDKQILESRDINIVGGSDL